VSSVGFGLLLQGTQSDETLIHYSIADLLQLIRIDHNFASGYSRKDWRQLLAPQQSELDN
jgi:hypothetical protein